MTSFYVWWEERGMMIGLCKRWSFQLHIGPKNFSPAFLVIKEHAHYMNMCAIEIFTHKLLAFFGGENVLLLKLHSRTATLPPPSSNTPFSAISKTSTWRSAEGTTYLHSLSFLQNIHQDSYVTIQVKTQFPPPSKQPPRYSWTVIWGKMAPAGTFEPLRNYINQTKKNFRNRPSVRSALTTVPRNSGCGDLKEFL